MTNSNYVQGEILPPLPHEQEIVAARETHVTDSDSNAASNKDLDIIASWLDDRFVLPGIGIRFGLDALIGWIPGIGDALAAFASLYIVLAAWKRGVSRITLARMVLNLGIEDMVGAIPILGDLAHVAWKANRRNYNLLIRDTELRQRNTWQDWLFVISACLVLIVLFLAPFALLIYLLRSYR